MEVSRTPCKSKRRHAALLAEHAKVKGEAEKFERARNKRSA